MFTVRNANSTDKDLLLQLYKKVAARTIGIARKEAEITEAYIQHFMEQARETGIQLVVTHENVLIGEIHCYQLFPAVFSHVLSELTIVVDPDFHGKGIGKLIFTQLLNDITANRPDILRVELIARESNQKAIALYQKLGFKEEGRFEKRIAFEGGFEADIPMAWFNPAFKQD